MTATDVTLQDKQAQEALREELDRYFKGFSSEHQLRAAVDAALSQGTQPTVDQASMSLLSDARIDEIIVSTLGLGADEYAMAEFARVVEAAVLAELSPVERSQPVAVEAWKVETKPDGVRFRIGNQGFRLADPGPDDWPGRQEFLARMLTKALEHLVPEPAQGAGLTDRVRQLHEALREAIEAIEWMSGKDMSCDPPADVSDLRAALSGSAQSKEGAA